VVWSLFRRLKKPSHLLCHGFQWAAPFDHQGSQGGAARTIPGLQCCYPNPHFESVKGPLWRQLLAALGTGGDQLMIDLLFDCGIYVYVEGIDNLSQISGM
jgi:hypothetical protein